MPNKLVDISVASTLFSAAVFLYSAASIDSSTKYLLSIPCCQSATTDKHLIESQIEILGQPYLHLPTSHEVCIRFIFSARWLLHVQCFETAKMQDPTIQIKTTTVSFSLT